MSSHAMGHSMTNKPLSVFSMRVCFVFYGRGLFLCKHVYISLTVAQDDDCYDAD